MLCLKIVYALLCWAGLGWAGLGWAGLGWDTLPCLHIRGAVASAPGPFSYNQPPVVCLDQESAPRATRQADGEEEEHDEHSAQGQQRQVKRRQIMADGTVVIGHLQASFCATLRH